VSYRAHSCRVGASDTWSARNGGCSCGSSCAGDEHVDDIVVAEDDACVVVYGIVCTSVAGSGRDAYEGPWRVYLERPLGDRMVIDGVTGSPVPYKNVFAELARDCGEAPGGRTATRAAHGPSSASGTIAMRSSLR
jgi:hypothetical protein